MENNPYAARRRPRGTVQPDDKAMPRSIRLTDAQWRRFLEMGGTDWLRTQLDGSMYRPDPTMCGTCQHLFDAKCSTLRFHTMEKMRAEIDGIVRVRCTSYQKDEPITPKEA